MDKGNHYIKFALLWGGLKDVDCGESSRIIISLENQTESFDKFLI